MDVLETPGTRLTSVRFTLTTASRSVAWTVVVVDAGYQVVFDYAPIILREMKFSKGWG